MAADAARACGLDRFLFELLPWSAWDGTRNFSYVLICSALPSAPESIQYYMHSVLSTAFPSLQTYQEFEEAGTDLAQALNKKEKVLKQRGMDADVAKALGKLSSGLYVVTAEHTGVQGGARSAMIASWVAQASFEPLGLTIAVAKDRAIESLMQVRQPTSFLGSSEACFALVCGVIVHSRRLRHGMYRSLAATLSRIVLLHSHSHPSSTHCRQI